MSENYPTPAENRIRTKAVENLLRMYSEEYNKEVAELTKQLEHQVTTARIFFESYNGFPKIACIKLLRHVYNLSLVEAKEVVEHVMQSYQTPTPLI